MLIEETEMKGYSDLLAIANYSFLSKQGIPTYRLRLDELYFSL